MVKNELRDYEGSLGLESGLLNNLGQYRISLSGQRLTGVPGSNLSRLHGRSDDFDGYRRYAAGDDWRSIDWGISARFENPLVRVSRVRLASKFWMLLDMSPSMKGSQGKKYQFAKGLLMAFSYLALNSYQSVTAVFGGEISAHSTQYVGSKGQFPGLMRTVGQLPLSESFRLEGAVRKTLSMMGAGSQLFVFSDLYELNGFEGFGEKVGDSGKEVIFLHLISPEEAQPTLRGEWILEDSESSDVVKLRISPEVAEKYASEVTKWQLELSASADRLGYRYVSLIGEGPLNLGHVGDLVESKLVVRR